MSVQHSNTIAREPRRFTREYRGGTIECYPAVREYYPSFDGVAIPIICESEAQAQAAIDDYRLYLVERELIAPEIVPDPAPSLVCQGAYLGQPDDLDAADTTIICPDCDKEFDAAVGVVVDDPSDEDGALMVICPDCATPDPADLATPEQIAKRDAENEADMLDFLRGGEWPDDCRNDGQPGAWVAA